MRRMAVNPFDRTARPFLVNEALPLEYFDGIRASLDVADFVQGLLVEGSLAVVYGESNSGKTFWTTDLALHIASGLTWMGRRVEQGGVVYCVLEGGQAFRNRIAAWREYHAPSGHVHFAAVPAQVSLLDVEASVEPLIAAIRLAARTMDIPVKLVVIDTLSRALAGANENGPEDMGQLVVNVDRLRRETGSAVAFVHHSGKSTAMGARGHSLLRGAVDTEIEVKEHEGSLRTATVEKQRETRKGDEFPFRLDVVELGKNRHGEAVTTCVVAPVNDETGQPDTSAKERSKLAPTTRRALEVLADLCAASGKASETGTPSGSISVHEDAWRDKFYERALAGADAAAKRKGFRRAADALVTLQMVGMAVGRVWLAERRRADEPPPHEGDEIPE